MFGKHDMLLSNYTSNSFEIPPEFLAMEGVQHPWALPLLPSMVVIGVGGWRHEQVLNPLLRLLCLILRVLQSLCKTNYVSSGGFFLHIFEVPELFL